MVYFIIIYILISAFLYVGATDKFEVILYKPMVENSTTSRLVPVVGAFFLYILWQVYGTYSLPVPDG